MTYEILVPGTLRDTDPKGGKAEKDGFVEITMPTARGETGERVKQTLDDKHLIEVELENGLTLFRHIETLEGGPMDRPARGDGPLELPRRLQIGKANRAGGGFLVRAYRFFSGETVTDSMVRTAAKAIEGQLKSDKDTLYRCLGEEGLSPIDDTPPAAGSRMLVMIHGTASSTSGSFGGLVPLPDADGQHSAGSALWKNLQDGFRDEDNGDLSHIYAFEHHTLTQSPVENAINLLKQLPDHAELHLLTHSRGGLIGELIARAQRVGENKNVAPFDKKDRELYEKARRSALARAATKLDKSAIEAVIDKERKDLDILADLLGRKKPVIKGFVRVACPAQGTLLAADRLDRYLSLVFNLMNLLPGPHKPFTVPFKHLVQKLVASRKDVGLLPGLEAMMPTAPLIALINRPDVTLHSPLCIVAGDIEPKGVLRGLATLASDLYFGTDHDVVVHTRAMSAGSARKEQPYLLFDQGGEVSHFSYFQNQSTAPRIVAALCDGPENAGIDRLVVPQMPSLARGVGEITGKRPVVFMLPGIQGSRLKKGNDLVWLDILDLAFGGIGKIGGTRGLADRSVRSTESMPRFYHGLMYHLARVHDVVDFHYDWRKSIKDAAQRLGSAISEALDRIEEEQTDQPVHILAHSMGGLVARMMIQDCPEVWKRMKKQSDASRLVMLGTPNGGSMSIVWSLIGKDKLIRQLATLDVTNSMAELLKEIMPMPGVLELLPHDLGGQYFEPATWKEFSEVTPRGWTAPNRDALNKAKETLGSLTLDPADAERMVYLAGKADMTPVSIEIEKGKRPRARLMVTRNGDGRVTWRTGQLPGVRTWFAPNTEHGDLCRDRSLFPAISDLLQRGETTHLSQQPPVSRGGEGFFEYTPEPVFYPTQSDVEAAALGGSLVRKAEAVDTRPPCHVRVCHGDLRVYRGTIAVGHYENAALFAAESALDEALNGQLSQHRNLGLYPGELNSAEVFCNPYTNFGPNGALVVGLGPFGDLSKASLTNALARAFMLYALRAEKTKDYDGSRLTTLLIGHRDSLLTVKNSVQATLKALANANETLPRNLAITDLKILELFEDTAIEATEALSELNNSDEIRKSFKIDTCLHTGHAGRKRIVAGGEPEWEQKIRITTQRNGRKPLCFEGLNRSALVSNFKVEIDRRRLDRHIRETTSSTSKDERTGKLMFEWMLPPTMKNMISDGRQLVLVMDKGAAGYPWELMEDNWSSSKKPVAVTGGVIRQLIDKPRADRPIAAASERVLVIGDPESHFRPLDGAVDEAKNVAASFKRHGWTNVNLFLREEANVSEQLSLHENRIVHFAGHGVHQWGREKLTGLIIGKNNVLEPQYIRSLRYAPQFVFLNCCHVGKLDGDFGPEEAEQYRQKRTPQSAVRSRSEFAANLAVEFMQAGSQAVIAAGWAIDDQAAATFSNVFYDEFLAGKGFAEAVRIAREQTYENHKNFNTWGAFQCYGDAQFNLRQSANPPRRSKPAGYASASQAALDLRTLRIEASFAETAREAQILRAEFDRIVKLSNSNERWRKDPGLQEAIGGAASELGDIDLAIEHFQRAFRGTPASSSLEMLETLLELRVRQASLKREHAGSAAEKKKCLSEEDERIQDMLEELIRHETLGGGQGSWRRQARIGDSYLRQAAIDAGDINKTLEKAISAYERAERLAHEHSRAASGHPRLRKALTNFLLSGSPISADTISAVRVVKSDLMDEDSVMPNFDRARLLAEARLFELLINPSGETLLRDELLDDFSRMFMNGASPGKRREMIADLKTVSALLAKIKTGSDAVRRASDQIGEIAEELNKSVPGRAISSK